MKSFDLKFVTNLALAFLLISFVNFAMASDIPKTLNHQGYLTDSEGNPVNAPGLNMEFTLFDDDSNSLWSESRTVAVTEGNYTINLGESNPIQLPFDQPYSLGIMVEGEPMDQTYPLTSVPYAFGGRPVVSLTEDNFENAHVRDGVLVAAEGVFTIDGNYERLDFQNLFVHGGKFAGSSDSAQIEFGNDTVISGAEFEDVTIDGADLVFENCSFSGSISLTSGALLRHCYLSNVSSPVGSKIRLENSEIHNSALKGAEYLAGCEILGSNIHELTHNTDVTVTNCTVRESKFYLGYGSSFIGNNCEETYIGIWDAADGSIVISGNKFRKTHGEEDEIIYIQALSQAYRYFTICNNNFHLKKESGKYAITSTGSPTGLNQILKISGNIFMSGEDAIGYLGNFRTVVSDNVTRNINLGVQNSTSYLIVNNNHHFE